MFSEVRRNPPSVNLDDVRAAWIVAQRAGDRTLKGVVLVDACRGLRTCPANRAVGAPLTRAGFKGRRHWIITREGLFKFLKLGSKIRFRG